MESEAEFQAVVGGAGGRLAPATPMNRDTRARQHRTTRQTAVATREAASSRGEGLAVADGAAKDKTNDRHRLLLPTRRVYAVGGGRRGGDVHERTGQDVKKTKPLPDPLVSFPVNNDKKKQE
jgi:hypothetical protein